jgi:hypothetical protein
LIAEVPNPRSDNILAAFKKRPEIESLIAPMSPVSAGRSIADTLAIDIQLKPVVRADMYQIVRWQCVKRNHLSERGYLGRVLLCAEGSNPLGVSRDNLSFHNRWRQKQQR